MHVDVVEELISWSEFLIQDLLNQQLNGLHEVRFLWPVLIEN